MRALLKKNLVAHKQTNKLTSIIYALTLGCVIFLCVSLNLVLNTVNSSQLDMPGTDIYVTSIEYADLNATAVDPILTKYADDIKQFGWVTWKHSAYYEYKNQTRTAKFADTGHQYQIMGKV